MISNNKSNRQKQVNEISFLIADDGKVLDANERSFSNFFFGGLDEVVINRFRGHIHSSRFRKIVIHLCPVNARLGVKNYVYDYVYHYQARIDLNCLLPPSPKACKIYSRIFSDSLEDSGAIYGKDIIGELVSYTFNEVSFMKITNEVIGRFMSGARTPTPLGDPE